LIVNITTSTLVLQWRNDKMAAHVEMMLNPIKSCQVSPEKSCQVCGKKSADSRFNPHRPTFVFKDTDRKPVNSRPAQGLDDLAASLEQVKQMLKTRGGKLDTVFLDLLDTT
jgi:hypothetical protein